MNFDLYKQAFTEKATLAGYSADEIAKCLNYAEPILSNNLPIIYNLTHLSLLTGLKKEYIAKASFYTLSYYRIFKIHKKGSKEMRTITEPLPSLRKIQNWILKNILEKVPISPVAKAYVKNQSLIDNVKFHKKQKYVLTLD